ncbi:MAG: hypothetical protein HYT89_02040 [Candidatus Omnitrophica bacterium]|nr:hypothetical protein [Candidatus Omnitrophota bacterium]
MPLTGGPADKLGNRYELWWTVLQFVRMLHGKAERIRIEDPNVTKAEFVIVHNGHRELHQAKRSHQSGKWSNASLASSDMQLLQGMFDQLLGNDNRFVFVSGSAAEELKELAHRAEKAETVEEFESKFLEAEIQKVRFDTLKKKYWKNTDTTTAYEILRRIEVKTVDEKSLEEQVHWGIRALFLADPNIVCAELRCIAEDSIHQTITREALIERLAQRGFMLRRLAKLDSAAALVGEATERYLAVVRKKLIRKSLIPRAATQTLLEQLIGAAHGRDLALTGRAGVGKTGCVIELVEALRARNIPVLAFRLDRLKLVSTTVELGQQLGLEESPALVLAAMAAGREAVLVVDQLDAVSTASGRSSDFLEAVEGILAETRGLRDKLKLHVVVVCRAFDWENDHRLRRLLSEQQTKVEVVEFSIDEVKAVLSADGFRTELLQKNQLELLRLPQNLSLFLEASFAKAGAPTFNTAKELFDRYWDEKRRAVKARANYSQEQWAEVIGFICEKMTQTQQLFASRESLDQFDSDYIAAMASEGVLTFENQRYGFGHESFFDYCFARAFIPKEKPLTEFLTASEQHLFRRAQVRQVLTYLRDADRDRYCKELRELLADSRIRAHIKDLAIALVVAAPDPGDDEWAVLEPWLNSNLAIFENSQKSPDKLSSMVWQHFFPSVSWFYFIERRGFIKNWLGSGKKSLIDMAVNYLRLHQRHAADTVAELLEPYIGQTGDWPQRLRFVMQWADLGDSRRFFDLFLRLIDDGTLDNARGPIAVNSTFWSMFHGLAKTQAAWVAEILAHWLRRRFVLVSHPTVEGEEPNWHDLFNNDEFGKDHLHDAATKAPGAFVDHVLPVVLEISDATIYSENNSPKRDAVWSIALFDNEYESAEDACRNTLATALQTVAKDKPKKLSDVVAELQRRDTYMANFLLLNLFAAGAAHFADPAVTLLCDQPWRFYCGFSESPHWIAMQLIKAVVSICSPENRTKLEKTIMSYSPDYERSAKGHKIAGRASFALLSAITPEYRSGHAQARYKELERKFGKPDGPPLGVHGGFVGSPIKKEAAEQMTDEQWLKAIAKYDSEEREDRWNDFLKGGARELARMLRDFVHNEPERFSQLSLRFPDGTNPVYIDRVIDGLKGTNVSTKLKLAVCRKAYSESREECGRAISDLLGGIQESLPEDAVQMLDWIATQHSDPEKDLWNVEATAGKPYYGGDIHSHGINTTRGRAAEAIHNLIRTDVGYVARFGSTLNHLVSDENLSVRSCAASTLLAVARHNTPLALELFKKLAEADDRLLATPYVDRFIYYSLHKNFIQVRPYVERMLRSKEPKVSEVGARLAGVAALYHEDAADLVNKAMSGSPSQRLGVVQVASANIARADCRTWCENCLLVLFNDDDNKVRREATSCFHHLKSEPLENYENLIRAFCDSLAYQEGSFPVLHVLEDSLLRLPGITHVVCEKFLMRFSDEAKDIQTSRAGDVHTVAKLIFRTYHQHQRDQWAPRCLDLIDKMCLEGIRDTRSELDEYER